ncbi:CoA transferase [Rhodococcus opacus]|uniref:CoA transferase n=1 Tax=Rhodococcus opacus TaxID=37919 RepID=UPI0027E1A9FD|nr:CoA transferase [Rhodococcus opacus]
MPGHDINYLALSRMLHAIGPEGRPVTPLNLIGDFGGGGMLLAVGIVQRVLEASRSGKGQVDGARCSGSMFYGLQKIGVWHYRWESNRFETFSSPVLTLGRPSIMSTPSPAWCSFRLTAYCRRRLRRDSGRPPKRSPSRLRGRETHREGASRLGFQRLRDCRPGNQARSTAVTQYSSYAVHSNHLHRPHGRQ